MKGVVIDNYRHNGYLYELHPNHSYVILATTAKAVESNEECKFMIRAIGPRVRMKKLKRHESDVTLRNPKRKSTADIWSEKSENKRMKLTITANDVLKPYAKKTKLQ